MRSIVLFTRDLRLEDNAALAHAAQSGDAVGLLAIDRARHARLAQSPRRAAFFCAAVEALADEIARDGGRLVVRRGPIARSVVDVARGCAAESVVWANAYAADEREAQRDLQAACEEAGLRVFAVHDAPSVAPEETAARRSDGANDGYRAFGAYDDVWRAARRAPFARRPRFAAADSIAGETLPVPAEFGSGETAGTDASPAGARRRLASFLLSGATNYASQRYVPSIDGTSRLDAHLSHGTIAARTVLAAVDDRARDPFLLTEERQSLAAFAKTLARRDFLYQLAWFADERGDVPLQAKMRRFEFARAHPQLDRWREGRTGFPLVDAGMRELAATGWLHPRVAQIAASFLTFDLDVDWRVGRDTWDRKFIADDPALASGAWQWAAGVGADLAAYPRIFHPVKQARRIDPVGAYVRRWIPEIASVPPGELFGRGEGDGTQLRLGLFGDDYPAPMLDHDASARAFLGRYRAFVAARLG